MKMKRTKGESAEVHFDVDQDFMDRVLNQLYDFGDGADSTQSKKKPKRRNHIKQEEEKEVTLDEIHCEKDQANVACHVTNTATGTERISASQSSQREPSTVEIVTFQDPRKKNKLKRAVEPETKPGDTKEKRKKDQEVLSMEKARLDVHRFGITGFQKQQQRVFEQDRAIMLGARPPKKDYVNYKVYQQAIKERKSKEKDDEAKLDAQKKKKKSSGKQKNVKRKSGSSGTEPTGHMGSFKNGMLVLSSKDIQKLNSKVRR